MSKSFSDFLKIIAASGILGFMLTSTVALAVYVPEILLAIAIGSTIGAGAVGIVCGIVWYVSGKAEE